MWRHPGRRAWIAQETGNSLTMTTWSRMTTEAAKAPPDCRRIVTRLGYRIKAASDAVLRPGKLAKVS